MILHFFTYFVAYAKKNVYLCSCVFNNYKYEYLIIFAFLPSMGVTIRYQKQLSFAYNYSSLNKNY